MLEVIAKVFCPLPEIRQIPGRALSSWRRFGGANYSVSSVAVTPKDRAAIPAAASVTAAPHRVDRHRRTSAEPLVAQLAGVLAPD
jgi:hypothetical protein